jgi:hypothetical protein
MEINICITEQKCLLSLIEKQLLMKKQGEGPPKNGDKLQSDWIACPYAFITSKCNAK